MFLAILFHSIKHGRIFFQHTFLLTQQFPEIGPRRHLTFLSQFIRWVYYYLKTNLIVTFATFINLWHFIDGLQRGGRRRLPLWLNSQRPWVRLSFSRNCLSVGKIIPSYTDFVVQCSHYCGIKKTSSPITHTGRGGFMLKLRHCLSFLILIYRSITLSNGYFAA